MAKRKPTDAASPDQVCGEIAGLVDAFCKEHLNAEYADLCGKLAEKLARKRPSPLVSGKPQLYTLEVFLLSGPIPEKFAKKNPVISRTVQIRDDQTLEDLHHAIFDAFDRFDDHMYEFQFGKGPMDPEAPRYVLPNAFDMVWAIESGPPAGWTRLLSTRWAWKWAVASAIGSTSATIGGTRST